MIKRRGCFGIVLGRVGVAALAVGVLAGGLAPASVAQQLPPLAGTYRAVVKPYTIDRATGARIYQPDFVNLWNVFSSCSLPGCTAHVMSGALLSFDMVSDGAKWDRIAVPATGPCRLGPIPARFAQVTLVPRSDGSLSGTLTSMVDCDGVPMGLPLPLELTTA